MRTLIASILYLAQEAEENAPEDLYPLVEELLVGAVAFGVLFFFMWKWVFPRANKMLEERRARIQGELEKAEESRRKAEQLLAQYEDRLREARGEANRIIDEARKTAESMRKDLLAKAEDEARQVVGRAQEEIKAERARASEELRREMGELSVDIASRVIGQALDRRRHGKLVDEYIRELTSAGNGQRDRAGVSQESDGGRKRAAARSGSAKTASKKSGSSKRSSSKRSSSKARGTGGRKKS